MARDLLENFPFMDSGANFSAPATLSVAVILRQRLKTFLFRFSYPDFIVRDIAIIFVILPTTTTTTMTNDDDDDGFRRDLLVYWRL